MLAREVLRLRGTLASREAEWDVMTDLYFYRDPEAEENKDAAVEETKAPGAEEVGTAPAADGFGQEWEVTGTNTVAFNNQSTTAAPGGSWDADATTTDWAASGDAQTGTEGWGAETAAPATTTQW